ncbi:uncharacterized protein LOC123428301 [Hordeum vulgare subsp. vulgare]|uniref:uncharacterized protein LOC123428301 n=1 Tax=Hordeum vulgare subsp. vulgare TaxID=112509 RepID=UPI001D1A496E|nr:uncharacterized protein LOC123428301 [Hordeum vulgare subsp. vulgare]
MSNIYTMDPSLISMLSVYFEILDIIITPISTCFEENVGPTGTRLDGDSPNDIQDYSSGGDLLPGIEGFQVVGNPIPGSTLRACGFSINGTTHCNFQWVHYLEDGTRQSIEGATMYDYVVTADDVGAVLVVECTPMDDHGRQGHLLMEFANSKQKITCGKFMLFVLLPLGPGSLI